MSSFDSHSAALRYTKGAAWLHWLIGLAVIGNIAIAELTEDLAKPERYKWMGLHMTIGIVIMLLTFARIFWRLRNRPPAMPVSIPGWQQTLGKAAHFIFYVLLLALPLSGWIWMSARAEPVVINMFGMFGWPVLPIGDNKSISDAMHEAHEVMGKAMLILVILHFVAALKHQFVDKARILGRMNPLG
ncbi:MAG: hypothetical protein RLZZ58_2096 [Pseudomonadota bacterium]